MFTQTVKLDKDLLGIIQRELKDARAKVRRLMFRVATGPTVLKTIRGLSVEPGKPRYPIQWQSQKQRRYVMAKLRRENNLPYMRTHRLSQGWTAVVGEGASIQFVNSAPYTKFVQGTPKYQQIMHKGRWVAASPVIRKAAPDITREVADQFLRSFGRSV